MSVTVYLEGGGDSHDLQTRCREGFRKLLIGCGYTGRMPKLVACGGRSAAFADFKTALKSAEEDDHILLWIDSEEAMADIEKTWDHLKARDGWKRPQGAEDEQVLLMTTCMETLIVADRDTLSVHYGSQLQLSALPALTDLEKRGRHTIQDALAHATRLCGNAYQKGKRSFEVLGLLNPEVLKKRLPSFDRTCRILDGSL